MPRINHGHYLSDKPNEFGVYEIRWTEDGRSKRKSTGAQDRRAAQRVYAEFIIALDGAANDGPVTVGQCLDAYLADKTGVMAKATQESDFGHIRAHFGRMLVREVDDADAQKYIKARARGVITYQDARGRTRGGQAAGPSTVRREISMMGAAIRYCITRRKFKGPDGRPILEARDQPLLQLPPAPPPRDRWITRDEAARLLAHAATVRGAGEPADRISRVHRYIAVMAYTASRKGAVIRLTWDRIVLQDDPVKLAAGDYGMIDFQEPGRKRTHKRRGWVPIAAELHLLLVEARAQRVNDWFLDKPVDPQPLFVKAAEAAGLPDISPHVLRHSWAVWAAQDGVDLWKIAGVLHDTMATVEKTYLHHCPQHLRSAVNRRLVA